MKYDPALHHRRSLRLPGYDYREAGAYFLTLVAYRRECLFGEMLDGKVRLSALGEVVAKEWGQTRKIRPEIHLDAFVVMPNHIHGIVVVRGPVGAHSRAPRHDSPYRSPRSLGSFVAGFKSAVTRRINQVRGMPGIPVWQRNYYEHVIRYEKELNRIRQYIADNPARWADDPENPRNVGIPSAGVGAHGRAPACESGHP